MKNTNMMWVMITIIVLFSISNVLSGASTTITPDQFNKALAKIEALEKKIIELQAPKKEIVVERLTIVNESGEKIGEFFSDEKTKAVRLQMYDINGSLRAQLSVPEPSLGGPSLFFFGNDLFPRNILITTNSEVPIHTEWKMLNFTAEMNCESYLTEKLTTVSCIGNWIYDTSMKCFKFAINVDTKTQPSWNYYLGQGRFSVSDRELRAAYQDAALYILNRLSFYIGEITTEIVEITFYIRGYEVGVWKNGAFNLKGE